MHDVPAPGPSICYPVNTAWSSAGRTTPSAIRTSRLVRHLTPGLTPLPHRMNSHCTPECRRRGRTSAAGMVVTGHPQSPAHVIRGDAAAGAGPVPAPAWPAAVSATRRTKYRPRRSLPGEPPHRLTGRSRCRQPGCTQARSNRLCGDQALPGTPGRYPKQQSSLVVAQPERAPPFLPDQEGRAARNWPPEKQQAASRRMFPGVNSPASHRSRDEARPPEKHATKRLHTANVSRVPTPCQLPYGNAVNAQVRRDTTIRQSAIAQSSEPARVVTSHLAR